MDDHPPKPRLTLRVGITGSSLNKLDDHNIQQIKLYLIRLFSAIEAAANEILQANVDVYASEPPQFRLATDFAQGVDQLAVSACPSHWLVEGILTFPKDDYLHDSGDGAVGDDDDLRKAYREIVSKASTLTQFPLPKPENRDRACLNAGSYLLRQIDLLIAVWDGAAAKRGGGATLAKQAFQGGIPVAWLSTSGRDAPRLLTGFDANGDASGPEADCTEGPLLAALNPILAGPSPAPGRSDGSPRAALTRFYQETWHAKSYSVVYDFLRCVANLERPHAVIRARSFQTQCSGWDRFLGAAPEVEDLRERLRQVLLPRFVWADALAVYFSHRYRSAYILAYLLSSVAVFIGLVGAFVENFYIKGAVVTAEFVVIVLIMALVFFGQRWAWHERWLEYRSLAESLRHGRFLAFVSEFGRVRERSAGVATREPPWTLWYLRSTMRELGLPSAVLDSIYQWRVLNATVTYEIDEQISYHEGNHRSVHRIDRLLHWIGIVCFLVTVVILTAFLLGFYAELIHNFIHHFIFGEIKLAGEPPRTALGHIPSFLRRWMFVCTAGLPALAAALAGIRGHGDFESAAERSASMIESLTLLKHDYESAMRQEGTLDDTAERLIAASRMMSEDLAAWEQLYGRKRLALPA